MPEEKKVDLDGNLFGEDEGTVEIPADIMPLFFTSKTQEIFGCIGDDDVTEESPYKLIAKELILKDFKDRAAVSDFHPVKKIVQDYPGEEVLVVYDPPFKYGQNFYMALTEEAKERIMAPPDQEPEAGEDGGEEELQVEGDVVIDLRRFPRTPQPWDSLGSEFEVEEETVIESRPKVRFQISRKRREFGAPVFFSDRNVSDAKDGLVECPSYEDENYSLEKKELDKAVQAVPVLTHAGSQTDWRKPRNAVTQYVPRTFTEKEKDSAVKSTTVQDFVQSVAPRFELSLQQNEIVDVFYDDYLNLADDDTTFGSKSDNYLKEYQSFTDLLFSKQKTITNIEWHPTIKGIIAVSCAERLSFDERVDQSSSRILMTPSLILIWSFSDPIHPLLLLEAPDDTFSFKFNPSDPNIIAAGCINGQVVLWDITQWSERLKSHRQAHGQTKKNTMNSLPGFEDGSSSDRNPIRYCAVSSIEHGHKTSVTDVQWIPDHMEIGRMGYVVENKSLHCNQLMTCAADGGVLFWDTRPNKSAPPTQAAPGNPAGVPTTFKHLDLTWKPILKVTVSHQSGNGEFGPAFFSISEVQGKRQNAKDDLKGNKEPHGVSRMPSNLSKGKDQGKPLDNISTKFFVGTEEGDLVYLDWKPEKDTDSGRIMTLKPEQVLSAHDGPIATLHRSPFFKDIILTVGGWTFAIWKEGVTSGPLLQSASHVVRLTKGRWSPSRPGVFFITKVDGNVDVWDLLDRSHEPSLTQNVTASSITTICPHQISSKQQLLAVGDGVGTLHVMEVPWNLRHPSANEATIMDNFFEREVKRLSFVEERMKVRDQEKKQRDADEARRQQDAKKPEETEADVEARLRMEYQEYLEMEQRLLEELGIRTEPEDNLDV